MALSSQLKGGFPSGGRPAGTCTIRAVNGSPLAKCLVNARLLLFLMLCCLIAPSAMFYGAVALWITESIPAHIRYASFSVPYHRIPGDVAAASQWTPACAADLTALWDSGRWIPQESIGTEQAVCGPSHIE